MVQSFLNIAHNFFYFDVFRKFENTKCMLKIKIKHNNFLCGRKKNYAFYYIFTVCTYLLI